jgi:hypothetical protein
MPRRKRISFALSKSGVNTAARQRQSRVNMIEYKIETDICPSEALMKTPLPHGRASHNGHRGFRCRTKASDLPDKKHMMPSASALVTKQKRQTFGFGNKYNAC